MRLVITGASGFIGRALCARLLEQGHHLTLLTHSWPTDGNSTTKRWVHWTPGAVREWKSALSGVDGVINLAGEPIAEKKWSHPQKRRIEKSRVDGTNSLVEAIAEAQQKPQFLINASAVGYYGPHGDEILTEESPHGEDFLSVLCRDWEEEANKARPFGLRVCCLRTGIVLGSGGGALKKMAEPFKYYLGGQLGSGKQWISWIHMDDHVRLIIEAVNNTRMSSPVNATAPNPVPNKEFCQTLAKVMGRPCWATAPAFMLRLALGEMADMVLTGQRVVPAVAEKLGFQFRYVNLTEALEACKPF